MERETWGGISGVKLSFSVSIENYSVHCGQLKSVAVHQRFSFRLLAGYAAKYFQSDGI